MSKKKFDPNDTAAITDELDQSGFFRPQPTPQPVASSSAPLPNTNTSANADLQKSANTQHTTLVNEEAHRAALRKTYDKTSYRLCPEAFDAIETSKKLLKRKFGIRASFEDIAEAALMMANEDLEKNGEHSELVKRLSAILQMQK